jgi:hypothetical protein
MDRPLHVFPMEPGDWWACEYPERPVEPATTMFDENCPACRIGAEAYIRMNGEIGCQYYSPEGWMGYEASSTEILEKWANASSS